MLSQCWDLSLPRECAPPLPSPLHPCPRCPGSLIVVVQSLSHVRLLATPRTAACQASLSFTVSQSLLKLMPLRPVMLSKHLILYCPLLLLPSILPSIRVFSSESALPIPHTSALSNSCPDHVCITLPLPCAPRISQSCQTTLNQVKGYCWSQMDTR